MKVKTLVFTLFGLFLFYSCGIKKYSTSMEQMMITETKNIKYTEKEINQDIDYFIQSVEQVCPFPYMNSDSNSIQKLAMDLKK
jgi:hypothetical protein